MVATSDLRVATSEGGNIRLLRVASSHPLKVCSFIQFCYNYLSKSTLRIKIRCTVNKLQTILVLEGKKELVDYSIKITTSFHFCSIWAVQGFILLERLHKLQGGMHLATQDAHLLNCFYNSVIIRLSVVLTSKEVRI